MRRRWRSRLRGLFATANAGNFNGRTSIFILTGIRYTDTLQDSGAIADYFERLVRQAVDARFQ